MKLLKSLGMITVELAALNSRKKLGSLKPENFYEVFLNGKLLGYVNADEVKSVETKLRYLKALISSPEFTPEHEYYHAAHGLSKYMEICLVPNTALINISYNIYPGLYLFTSPGRMMRPVRNLHTNSVEYIGTMEQCYLNVCIWSDEYKEGATTHQELYPYSFMSVMANLTPFSEFNQSPRNMYQCQVRSWFPSVSETSC